MVQQKTLWIGMALLSGCTLGSQYHEKKHLSKECFIDLNSVPSPTPDQKCQKQAEKIYTYDLQWLQQEHQTLETDVTPEQQNKP